MRRHEFKRFPLLFIGILAIQFFITVILSAQSDLEKTVQGYAILTVSESKRLIAKGVARMPIVKNALANGMVIITKGTTNAYVVEEIMGKKIEKAAYVRGRVEPVEGGKKLPSVNVLDDIVLEKGKEISLPLTEAVKKLKPGDVVIKGANALDYRNKLAGVNIRDLSSGTTGIIMPHVVGKKAYLVIPIGLEKLVAGDLVDISLKMREPVESLNPVQSMFLITGEIVTELEAIKILTGATAFQASAGGIGGAEGAAWVVFRGTRDQVTKVMELVESIQGEPPYVE